MFSCAARAKKEKLKYFWVEHVNGCRGSANVNFTFHDYKPGLGWGNAFKKCTHDKKKNPICVAINKSSGYVYKLEVLELQRILHKQIFEE